jgi:hypothetical protein
MNNRVKVSLLYLDLFDPLALKITPSGLFYLTQIRMARSPKLYFDHSFALYYIIYAYKLTIIE